MKKNFIDWIKKSTSDSIWTGKVSQKSQFYWLKLILLLTSLNLISAFIFSQILIPEKIFVPSFYSILQGATYWFENSGIGQGISFIKMKFVVFYGGVLFMSIPLIIFSYFCLGKNYTKRSALNILIFSLIGIFFALKPVAGVLDLIFTTGNSANIDFDKKAKDVQYYLIALVTGIFYGIILSLIWKNQMSAGGLDFIYTYLAIRTNIKINRVGLPVNIFFVGIAMIVTFWTENSFPQHIRTVIFLFFNSLVWGYVSLSMANQVYPKFVPVQLWIVTKKTKDVIKEMRKKHKRGGFIIDVTGLYQGKKRKVVATSITYIELKYTINLVRKSDPKAFFIVNPIKKIFGNFEWKN